MPILISENRTVLTRSTRRWLGVAITAVFMFRLFLTADRDVVALNAPYDEFWFIHSAARMVWGGDYNHLAFAHLPIYSIWLAALNLLGVPARLGIDLAWLASTAYAGFALTRLSRRTWTGVAFWVFSAFHPLFLVLFDRALSETLLSALVAVMLGAGVEIWNTRDAAHSRRGVIATWLFAVAFALAVHTRKEGILFVLPLALLLAGSLLFLRRQWWLPVRAHALGVRLVAVPLLAMVAIGAILAGANYLRWGLAVRYELAAPGYTKAMAALNRIDAGRGPLHVTVTSKARQLAYQHSPTFRELQGFFEGEAGRSLAAYTARYTGQEGEIGNGWFYWALRDAGAVAGWHSSARRADQKYAAVAAELEAAFASGALKARPGWTPSFLDPDLGKWLGRVPASSWNIFNLIFATDAGLVRAPDEDATDRQWVEFIEIAARRNPLPTVKVSGWIVLPPGSSVGLSAADGTLLHQVALRPPMRPDVPGAFPFSLAASSVSSGMRLIATTPDGTAMAVPLSKLQVGTMTQTDGARPATLGVDELVMGKRPGLLAAGLAWWVGHPVSLDWIGGLSAAYRVVNAAFVLLVVGTLVLWASTRRRSMPAMIILALVAVALVSRAVLLGVLDASSWNGVQARYMMPVIPAFAWVALLGLHELLEGRR